MFKRCRRQAHPAASQQTGTGVSADLTTPKSRSLFGEILDWMLAPLLLLWPTGVALTWLVVHDLANRPYDRALIQDAQSFAHVLSTAWSPTEVPSLTAQRTGVDSVLTFYQVRDIKGTVLVGTAALPLPPELADAGTPPPGAPMHLRDDTVDGHKVRVASMSLPLDHAAPGQPAIIQYAQTTEPRSRLATEMLQGMILPQLVILPLAVLLMWLSLARGIAPLNALQQRIRQRTSDDLSPIDERDVPEEVGSLVRAINDLLARLSGSIRTQKHFLANAAHQLKTPLAGLRMQAELAQRDLKNPASPQLHDLQASLQHIVRATQRATRMVNQLLAMARAEDDAQALQMQTVDLARLATDTVRDFLPHAMTHRIDLGYEGPAPAPTPPGLMVTGHRLLLREMLSNLVDNALQYTPPGGTVTVRLSCDTQDQAVTLQVEDTGPGVSASERELIFQPFYRALGTAVDGSGLGLAIVREIARQHGAHVCVKPALTRPPPRTPTTHAPGACFVVHFNLGLNPFTRC